MAGCKLNSEQHFSLNLGILIAADEDKIEAADDSFFYKSDNLKSECISDNMSSESSQEKFRLMMNLIWSPQMPRPDCCKHTSFFMINL